jgi:hypothetical protein
MTAMSSLTVVAGTEELTISTLVEATASVTGSKSLYGSYGTLSKKLGLMTKLLTVTSMVWPSRPPRGPSGANIAAGAWNVLHIELLSESLAQFLGDKPGEHVGGAAGSIRHDDLHRPRRIGLRPSDMRDRRKRGNACGQMQKLPSVGEFHAALLFSPHVSRAEYARHEA